MKLPITRFAIAFVALVFLFALYIGLRIAVDYWQWGILLLSAGSIASFPLFHWIKSGGRASIFKILSQQFGFLSMSWLSWLLTLTITRDLYLMGALVIGGRETSSGIARNTEGLPAFFLSLLLTGIAFYWSRNGLRVKEVNLPIRDLPERLENLRVVQISDLHIGPTIGAKYVEKVVSKVNALEPDITVLTGDIVDGSVLSLEDVARQLGSLNPKGRVFFAPGNHDYYWQLSDWKKVFASLGVETLMNQGKILEAEGGTIWIAGVTDPVAVAFGGEAPSPEKAASGSESADLRILLSHRPEYVERAARAGFHLQLSGHTHGGQFFPWTFVASRVHKYFLGKMRFESTWLYVSAGTGSWGPPARFGTTPEITFLKIVRES